MIAVREQPRIAYVGEDLVDALFDGFWSEESSLSVFTATERASVLDRIGERQQPFDCVVCEHRPPELDAIEFLQSVASASPSIASVVLTDEGSESLASDAISAGLSEYVTIDGGRESRAAAVSTIEGLARETYPADGHRPSDTPYRHLVEQNIAGVYEIRDGEFSYVNRKFADIFGYEPEELVGTSPFELVVEADHGQLRENLEKLAHGEVETVETVHRGRRKDGDEVVIEAHGRLLEAGPDPVYLGFVNDITDRKMRERRFEAVFNNTYQFTGLLEPDGTILEVNDTALADTDLGREDVVGTLAWETAWLESNPEGRATIREAVQEARNGEQFRTDIRFRGDDEELILDYTVRPVTDERGNVTLLIAEGHDVTARKQRAERRGGVNEMLSDFMDADSSRQVTDIAIEAARSSLNLPIAMIALVDEESGELGQPDLTDAARRHLHPSELLDRDEGIAREAFVAGEATRIDVSTSDACDDAASVHELFVHPIGRHGVIVAGSPVLDADFARTLAGNIRRTLDRIERESRLREREEALTARNEWLDRLNRINEVIRTIDQVLVGASTRQEIARAVCEELVATESYTFAWMGKYDKATKRIDPQEWAGDEQGYLDARSFSAAANASNSGPPGRAVRRQEPHVLNNVLTDPPREPWREAALRRNFRSAIALPLSYRESLYGVLTVYSDQPALFDDLEREVLAELSETIAHAINAVETRQALVSDSVVEVELRIDDSNHPLVEFTGDDADREFLFEGVVPADDDLFRMFATMRGATADELLSFARQSVAVSDTTVITERDDGCLFETTVTEESLIFWLLDRGAVPKSMWFTEGEGRLRVELARDMDVGEFVEFFKTEYRHSELVASRERERPPRSPREFRAAVEDELTGRQREMLRMAYFSGYFETPRRRTGTEIADAVGISPSTFSDHIRAGLSNLLGLLYDDGRTRYE